MEPCGSQPVGPRSARAAIVGLAALLLVAAGCEPDAAELADAAWAAGDARQAMAHYTRAVAEAPADPALAERLGEAQARYAEQVVEGRAEASDAELEALVAAARRRPPPWPAWRRALRRRLADRRLAEGRPLQAVVQHVALGRDWPDCPTCATLAQAAAEQLPATPEGVAAFRELVQAWPHEVGLHESFARWLADHGRREAAITEYQKLLYSPAVAADLMLSARLQVALKLLHKKSNNQDLPGKTPPE